MGKRSKDSQKSENLQELQSQSGITQSDASRESDNTRPQKSSAIEQSPHKSVGSQSPVISKSSVASKSLDTSNTDKRDTGKNKSNGTVSSASGIAKKDPNSTPDNVPNNTKDKTVAHNAAIGETNAWGDLGKNNHSSTDATDVFSSDALGSYNPYISPTFEYEDEVPEDAYSIENEPTELIPVDKRDLDKKNGNAVDATRVLTDEVNGKSANSANSKDADKTQVYSDPPILDENVPSYAPKSISPQSADSQSSAKEKKPKKMPTAAKVAWWVSGVLIVCIILAALGGWYWWHKQGQKDALQNCLTAQNALTSSINAAKQTLEDAKNSSQLTSSQVVNGALITQLQRDLATPIPTPLGCSVDLSAQKLQQQADTMKEWTQQMNALVEKTQKDVSELTESQNKKAMLSAQQQLKNSISVAQQAYQIGQAKIPTSPLLPVLQQRISAAQTLVNNPAATAAQIDAVIQRLTEATQSVQQTTKKIESVQPIPPAGPPSEGMPPQSDASQPDNAFPPSGPNSGDSSNNPPAGPSNNANNGMLPPPGPQNGT